MKNLQESISRIKNLMRIVEDSTEFTKNPYGDYDDDQAPRQTGPSQYGVNPEEDKKMDSYDSDGMGEGEIKEEGEETTTTTDTTTDTATSTSSSGGGTVSKWESGTTRSKGNPVGNTVWDSGRTKGPTYQGTGYKWTSGRGYGPTGKYAS